MPTQPPRLADRLLEWFCASHLLEEVQGDLHERYQRDKKLYGESVAGRRYWWRVLGFFRRFALKNRENSGSNPLPVKDMISNYLKIAWRNLLKNKSYSAINIGGLAMGMAVAMLIGLWVYDELSFDRYHENYDRIAQVKQHQNFNGKIETWPALPLPLGEELRTNYGDSFKRIVISSWEEAHFLAFQDKKFSRIGKYMEPGAPDMLSLKMINGNRDGLQEPSSVFLSESTAKALFGESKAINREIVLDSQYPLKVTGIYEDLPKNTTFSEIDFITPWQLKIKQNPWMNQQENAWGNNGILIYVELAGNADIDRVSSRISKAKLKKIREDERKFNPELFLEAMSRWHLHGEYKGGLNTGGKIEFVRLFGAIGVAVLLLACINFMNLSTARTGKRAKEVGLRKSIGSERGQLISQFFLESVFISGLAFIFSLLFIFVLLPFFNELANKNIVFPWRNPVFWLIGVFFSILTGLIAGSYPAFYLSSFQPVKVLKGTFRAGRYAAVPRKVLVVIQFTVSVVLMVGTIVVFRQVRFAKDRPVGYDRQGLIMMQMFSHDISEHFEAFSAELKSSGAVEEIAESSGPLTNVWRTSGDISWKGKDPSMALDFPNTGVSVDYGRTVGWDFKAGRDFSRDFASDSSALVINEAAAKFMGLKNPVGEIVSWGGYPFTIIGVIKDMIMQSPYDQVKPSFYNIVSSHSDFLILKLKSGQTNREALSRLETVFRKYAPESPFEYKFADSEYARKFEGEERVSELITFFAAFAILISCLGLFGLASYTAEQRIKELGVRKILGASVLNLWQLLSRDFLLLVVIALIISIPVAYYFMSGWLEKYNYRTNISWWIFAIAGVSALLITLFTVSYHAVKAALMNPVKTLKSE